MSLISTSINIQMYRAYILMIIIIFPLWSFGNQYLVTPTPEYYDTYLFRFMFVSHGLVFYLLSLKNKFIQKHIDWCFLLVCIGMNMGHGLLVSMSRFDNILVSGQILVMLLISVHMETIKQFLIFNILALFVVFYPSIGKPIVTQEIYFLELFTVSLVTFVVLVRKLKLISQLKESQSSLEKEKVRSFNAQRLSSLGQMAGGIAHEINNPLNIMNLYAEQMVKSSDDKEKLIHLCEKHTKTASRISKIVNGLTRISRDGSQDYFEAIISEDLIEGLDALTKMRFEKENINYKLNITNGIAFQGKLIELQQVIINLLNNAVDAVKSQEKKEISLTIFKNNKNIIIEIQDNGPGVPRDKIISIFDPFYTSKEVGKGTGLGLSISKTIIEEHRGKLYVDENILNKFVIRLPLT